MSKGVRRKELGYLRGHHDSWKSAHVRARAVVEERVAAETHGARIAFFKIVYDEFSKPTRKSDLCAALGVTRPTLDRWLKEYVDHMGGEVLADAARIAPEIPSWTLVADAGENIDGKPTEYPVVSHLGKNYEYEFRNGKHELFDSESNSYIPMPVEARFLIERMK